MSNSCLRCNKPFKEESKIRIKTPQSNFLGFVHESCYTKYTGKNIPEKKSDVKYLIRIDPKIFEIGYKKHDSKKGLFVKQGITGKAYLDFRNKGKLSRQEQVERGPLYYFENQTEEDSIERKILKDNNIKFRLD